MDVKPSVVMITGANRGIGRAIADRFYADGAQLALGVRDPAGFLHPYAPQRCLVAPTDVRSEPALQAWQGILALGLLVSCFAFLLLSGDRSWWVGAMGTTLLFAIAWRPRRRHVDRPKRLIPGLAHM